MQFRGSRRGHILVVDDDSGTRQTFTFVLEARGFEVTAAATGEAALLAVRVSRPDLALLDLRLPGISGLDLVRGWQGAGTSVPFVLMSGFNSTTTVVEAMHLGARTVIDKPISISELPAIVERALGAGTNQALDGHSRTRSDASVESRSGGERWAGLVLKAIQSDGDLRSLDIWAHIAGLSYSSLREACHIIRLSAHDCRDFARALRAVIRARDEGRSLDAVLLFHDERTMRTFFRRAGLTPDSVPSVDEFLDQQTFIPREHDALRELRRLLQSR